FFSSRRRHTRFSRDWSSDVCSSDLALLLVLDRVQHLVAGVELAGVDAEEGQRTDERVGHDLERQRGERSIVAGLAGQLLALVVRSEERRVGKEGGSLWARRRDIRSV